MYLSLHDVKELLQYHGYSLVAQQAGHGVEVQRADKALVEAGHTGVGITELFGAIQEIDNPRALGRGLALRLICK